ncbi:MAG: hypothetical protein ACYTFA_09730, partial [Planctomycetota bacterium]
MTSAAVYGFTLIGAVLAVDAGSCATAAASQPVRAPTADAGASSAYTSIFEACAVGGADEDTPSGIHPLLSSAVEKLPMNRRTKAWVFFRNKGIASSRAYDLAIERLAATYNRRAVERRIKRRTLPDLFDERDLPVVAQYTAQVEATGAQVHIVSKWLNGVSVYATRDQIEQIARLPFVGAMQPVRRSRRTPEDGRFSPSGDAHTGISSREPRGGGDTCASATVIPSIPFSDTGTTVGFINDYDQPCPFASADTPDVVYSYSPTEDTVVTIELCNGSDYNTNLYVYENT